MKSLNIIKSLLQVLVVAFASAMFATAVGAPVAPVMITLCVLSMIAGTKGIESIGAAYTLLSGSPITFNGKEAMEGIIEPAYSSPEIAEFLTIVEDIVAQEQIAFLGRISKITQKDNGCGTGALNKTIPMSEKFWNPVAVKAWLTQCEDDLEQTFFVWGTSKGIKRKDLTDTDFMDFVIDIMTTAVKDDALRFIWFGDTAADTIANLSFLNDASDIPFYNAVNGLWKQIFAAVTGATMTRVTVAENAGGTYVLQALVAGITKTYMASMMEQADPRLRADKSKAFYVTQSWMDNWLAYRESGTTEASWTLLEDGQKQFYFRGVPIHVLDFWDIQIAADMNDGTKKVSPHRALLTTKANLQVGLDSAAAVTDFKIFLDDVTEINHMKGGYKVDTKIVHDFMTIAAY